MRLSPVVWIFGIFLLALIGGGWFALASLKTPPPVPSPAPLVQNPVHKVIGKSVEGRDIEAYTYGTGATHVVFAGGMHGGYEWNSVLLAYQLMDYLDAHPDFVPTNVSVSVIPVINPDGLFTIIGKTGRFRLEEVPEGDHSAGRFNANGVDLNRNFDCKWQSKSKWRDREVSAGAEPFSEPEAKAVRDFMLSKRPSAVVYWHSQANAVYASECEDGVLPVTKDIMNTYARAAGYPAIESFDSYEVTGDTEGWLASIGIPAITVEMKTHTTVEWEQNLAGVEAVLRYFAGK